MFDAVTGGAGFIGSHLVDRLLEMGRKVIVIDSCGHPTNLSQHDDNRNLMYERIDIRRDYFEDIFQGVDTVYHLAALADIVPSIKNPEEYFRTNVNGTMKVMEAARKCKVKQIVYAASSSCYGIDPGIYPTPEFAHENPAHPYAFTKYLGEQTVMHWSKIYDIPAVSLRLFNVYGPRSRTTGAYGAVFGVFIAQLLAGKRLTVVGDGEQKRDFIFVHDVVSAMLAAKGTGIYNVGSGDPVSINKIADLLGAKDTVHIPTRPGEPQITHADINKIKATDFGWLPTTSIEKGVKIMLDNMQYWKDAPVWTPDSIALETKEWFATLGKTHV